MRVFIIKTASGRDQESQPREEQEQDTGRETTAAQARSQDDDGSLPCSALSTAGLTSPWPWFTNHKMAKCKLNTSCVSC